MAKRAIQPGPARKYPLRVDYDVYGRYQEFAAALDVTLGRLLNETIAYGLGDGSAPPEWWGSPEHRAASPDLPSGPEESTLRAPAGVPVRTYTVTLPVPIHAAYQRLALELNVTMSRLFREVLLFGLSGGDQTPSWWDEWQKRAAQDSLLELEGQVSPVSP